MNQSITRFVVRAVFVLALLFGFNSLAFSQSVPPLDLPQSFFMPGTTEGVGTHFTITDSQYLNVSLDSTEQIKLKMNSVPEMVTLMVEKSASSTTTSTQVTLSGFASSTTYYKYEDSYHNLDQFVTDANGMYSYAQDITSSHIAFIQPRHSTKFIKDNATGGDCTAIGAWNNTTKVCTVNTDLTETVQIDSDGVTLDGNGHTLMGHDTGNGVYLNGRTGVTVKNLIIKQFESGIFLYSSSGNTLTNNNTTSNYLTGVFLYASNGNTLANNTASNGYYGIILSYSNNNTLINNTVSNNTIGVGLNYSSGNTLINSTVSNNYYGIFLPFAINNTLTNNTVLDNSYALVIRYSSSGNKIYNNNFISNDFIQSNVNGYTYTGINTFSIASPIGGNYWSNFDTPLEGCNDANNDNFCDTSYTYSVEQDNLPWTKKDGWLASVTPTSFWSEISNDSGAMKIYEATSTTSTELKQLPSGWAINVAKTTDNDDVVVKTTENGTTYRWYQVQDATDGTTGWMKAGAVDVTGNFIGGQEYLKFEASRQAELETRATPMVMNRAERWEQASSTIDHYYNNTDTTKKLQSSNDLPSHLSILKDNNFLEVLINAIAKQESSIIDFDNEWVASDFGHGIMQVTDRGVLGQASKISIPTCEGIDRGVCYGDSVFVPEYGTFKRDYLTYKYYSNSPQAIDANIKDGISQIVNAFNGNARKSVAHIDENFSISTSTMRNISTVYRYNQGSPWKTQAAFMVYERVKSLSDIQAELISHGAVPSWVYKNITSDWQTAVLNKCPVSIGSFTKCVTELGKKPALLISATYLANTAGNLDVSQQDQRLLADEMTYVNNNSSIAWLRSPGELRIVDSAGNMTGVASGTPSENIPNSVYDSETKMATLFFPEPDIKYEVVGTERGKYGFVSTDATTGQTVSLHDVPTEKDAIHTLSIDWDALALGEKGVTMQIDENGDGTTESTIKIGSTIDDTQAPTTTPAILGTLGLNNWYTSDATISLTAVDNIGGVGVEKTVYSLDSGDWQTYATTTPIVISADGVHSLQYYTVDYFGNTEATSTLDFKIDTTAPTIFASDTSAEQLAVDGTLLTIPVTVNDSIDSNPTFTADKPLTQIFAPGVTNILITARDTAGNIATSSIAVTIYSSPEADPDMDGVPNQDDVKPFDSTVFANLTIPTEYAFWEKESFDLPFGVAGKGDVMLSLSNTYYRVGTSPVKDSAGATVPATVTATDGVIAVSFAQSTKELKTYTLTITTTKGNTKERDSIKKKRDHEGDEERRHELEKELDFASAPITLSITNTTANKTTSQVSIVNIYDKQQTAQLQYKYKDTDHSTTLLLKSDDVLKLKKGQPLELTVKVTGIKKDVSFTSSIIGSFTMLSVVQEEEHDSDSDRKQTKFSLFFPLSTSSTQENIIITTTVNGITQTDVVGIRFED